MLVKVADLLPNPFRKLERYPIDKQKVEDLKTSINDTSFWDNLLARPSPVESNKYEIAYGHHRMLALFELGIKEVDIPIRDLDNEIMLRIMANENMETWHLDPIVINETILSVIEYLERIVQACNEEWDSFPESIKSLFKNKSGFTRQRQKGGWGTSSIKNFLGDNWSDQKISSSLAILNKSGDLEKIGIKKRAISKPLTPEKEEVKVDRGAAEQFRNIDSGAEFARQVVKHKIPIEKQKSIAGHLAEKRVDKVSMPVKIVEAIQTVMPERKIEPVPEVKEPPNIDNWLGPVLGKMANLEVDLLKLKGNTQFVRSGSRRNELQLSIKSLHQVVTDILSEVEQEVNNEQSRSILQADSRSDN
jgi:hypothetical protein